jgi:hypothetical protein
MIRLMKYGHILQLQSGRNTIGLTWVMWSVLYLLFLHLLFATKINMHIYMQTNLLRGFCQHGSESDAAVFTDVSVKITISWDETQCNFLYMYQLPYNLKIVAIGSFEITLLSHKITRRHVLREYYRCKKPSVTVFFMTLLLAIRITQILYVNLLTLYMT